MSDKLKPCPFCGGRFLAYTAANGPLDGMVQMVCGCGARGPAVDDVPGAWPENIDAAWNLRTPDWQELACGLVDALTGVITLIPDCVQIDGERCTLMEARRVLGMSLEYPDQSSEPLCANVCRDNGQTPDWQELARELACIAAEQRLPYTCDSCGHKTDKPCPTDALGLCEAQRWYPTEVIVAMAVKAGLLEG